MTQTDAASQPSAEPEVLIRTVGKVGRITLNRPKALNALTTSMCAAMADALRHWRTDAGVRAVVVDAAGERAFCAGGDIRMLHAASTSGDHAPAEDFWRTEYALNALIAEYPKPYVAVMDAIVMGGGVGISVHGAHRVVGENTVFAMPETGIGYFPDVGGTFFLPRLPDAIGDWMALTGARLRQADCLAAGLATQTVPSDKLSALIEVLESADLDEEGDMVADVIDSFAMDPGETALAAPAPARRAAFERDNAADVLSALDAAGDEWSTKQASVLRSKSPFAVHVTHEAIKRGAAMDLRACLDAELAMSVAFLSSPDFAEGVRAAVIDKDNAPAWAHADLTDVPSEAVAAVFDRGDVAPLAFHD